MPLSRYSLIGNRNGYTKIISSSECLQEVISVDELRALYTAKEHPIVYDGFEPSGRMHIAQVGRNSGITSH